MDTVRHVFTHWITTFGGFAVAGLQYYVAHPVGPQKYILLATAILGMIAKDPNKS
jgi:hypothetical protein